MSGTNSWLLRFTAIFQQSTVSIFRSSRNGRPIVNLYRTLPDLPVLRLGLPNNLVELTHTGTDGDTPGHKHAYANKDPELTEYVDTSFRGRVSFSAR